MPREYYQLPIVDDPRILAAELNRILDSISRRLNFLYDSGGDTAIAGKKITGLNDGASSADAVRYDQIFLLANLASIILGTSNEITITDNGNETITISLPGSIKLDDATASRLLATDASKLTTSVANLASWIAGTTDQITITNDGDGTITLSLPQSIATTSSVLFNRLRLTSIWHAYGGFQSKAETINVLGAGQWAMITNVTSDLWTGLEADGLTLSNDIMTITNAGDYIGSLSMTFSGSNGKDFQIRLYNITQATQVGYVIGATTTGATNFTNIVLPLYIEAAANDTFRMETTCLTDASDPTFRSAVFWMAYLHD